MNRSSVLITAFIAILTAALWALSNQPRQEPPWPETIQGVSFSPLRAGNDPADGRYPTVDEIDRDLALLAGKTHAVRSYSVTASLAQIPRLARKHGLNVTLGAWIGPDAAINAVELDKAITLARENYRNVVRVLVGNEVLYRKDLPPKQLYAHLDRVRAALDRPVSTAEPWDVWLKNPELAEHVDFITVHLLPYWEGVAVDEAVEFVLDRYRKVAQAFPDKAVVIGEVGWPSAGRTRKSSVASVPNQARFLRRFLEAAEREKLTYYVLEAFDQPWKSDTEGAVGMYWGIYDAERAAKFTFTEPLVRVPEWRELAAISIVVSVLVLVLLFRDSVGLRSRGRSFLAFTVYTTATVAVWLIYEFTRQYMTASTVALGLLLLLAMTGVIVVLLAEAHEWAEALWLREWRRQPRPIAMNEADLPFVSVHVPAYNEPPEMLIATLNALAAMDYPRFEVLVIDNNTKDPAVWQPVEAHCRRLGPHFRFFHVDPLAGFKAGALNFGLRQTAPQAQVVAVIDSDYEVAPDWLRDLVPQFGDPQIAIVQAPQDYRDGDANTFKAMCLAEYRGFFHIGMVTRNERNAIIQHGTMTMVRRKVLENVGGWSEWCITEDAELGLRIFEAGYAATYIPASYGRGVMPDTFIDFKKQRFRWAYGAVMILRHHLGQLFALDRSQLTWGQRYHFIAGWLPWLADGFNLLFNVAAILWSAAMVISPSRFQAPLAVVAVFPLTLFAFKVLKLFFLYRRRVEATFRQSIAAALAGLALGHTIGLAILTGFATRRIGFFRTPKLATTNTVLKAISDAREEMLIFVALAFSIGGILQRQDDLMLDVQVWVTLLAVQSIPYLASLVVSLISAMSWLPASLVGTMSEMGHADRSGSEARPKQEAPALSATSPANR